MQIHELNSRAPTDTDEMALDTGSQTYKTRVGLLKPQFTSYDMANPTSWDDVPLITGNSSIVFVFERLTRMFRNIRYIWKLLGSNDFSNVAETISGAIGNTALTTTATDISGAIAEHEADISTLEEDISTINGNLSTLVHKSFTIPANTSKEITIPGGNSKNVFIFFSAYSPCRGMAVTFGQTNAAVTMINDPSGITATASSNKVTFAVTQNTYVEVITLAGDAPNVS